MKRRGRDLQPGDYAITDFEGRWKTVRIVARIEKQVSQSTICFQVDPPLRNCRAQQWIDADWFMPGKPPEQKNDSEV